MNSLVLLTASVNSKSNSLRVIVIEKLPCIKSSIVEPLRLYEYFSLIIFRIPN